MITGRKIGSISGPTIVMHVPGTSEIPAGERVSFPRGTRQSTPNTHSVVAPIGSRSEITNQPVLRVRATTPKPQSTAGRAVAQPAASSAARRPTNANPATPGTTQPEKAKTTADRASRAAKWLREEKAKVSVFIFFQLFFVTSLHYILADNNQQNRASAAQAEGSTNRRRLKSSQTYRGTK